MCAHTLLPHSPSRCKELCDIRDFSRAQIHSQCQMTVAWKAGKTKWLKCGQLWAYKNFHTRCTEPKQKTISNIGVSFGIALKKPSGATKQQLPASYHSTVNQPRPYNERHAPESASPFGQTKVVALNWTSGNCCWATLRVSCTFCIRFFEILSNKAQNGVAGSV